MINITDHHAQRLAKMSPRRIIPALADVLEEGAQAIVDTARFNINDGAISGSGHIPGPPGGYPNSDTHELEQSLRVGDTIETPQQVKTSAIADAPYAAYVERGTSKAEPRPYMELATGSNHPGVINALGRRFTETVSR